VAAHSKRARRLAAHLVLLDESGMLLAPLVRRTLAPRGQTPFLVQRAKHREKTSLLAALTLSPKKQRLGLYFSGLINQGFNQEAVAYFLRQLLKHLRGPVIVIWDRGTMHRGPEIRRLQSDYPRLHLESLPSYAPELNPVEQVWTHLKWGRLCNWAPQDVGELAETAYRELHRIRTDPKQLRNYWAASELPWPRALAS
jgi:putative transposase